MNTVFVLGAAANIELDESGSMPIGTALAAKIQDQLSQEFSLGSQFPDGPVSSAIASNGGLGHEHVRAMRKIEQGITHVDSIDKFIDEWSDQPFLPEVGKLLIAHQILEAELRTGLPHALDNNIEATRTMRSIRDSWLGQILRFANPSARRRDVHKCLQGLSFITFNYDRCLEACLYLFARSQGLDEEEAMQVTSHTTILHAYGSLGSLDEMRALGAQNDLRWHHISKASERIQTFTERVQGDHADRMRNVIAEAEKIVFLGFGYHGQNLQLISPISMIEKEVFGTAYRMRGREKVAVDDFFVERDSSIEMLDCECSEAIDRIREKIF